MEASVMLTGRTSHVACCIWGPRGLFNSLYHLALQETQLTLCVIVVHAYHANYMHVLLFVLIFIGWA